ncbi:hypothetical protein JCM11641_002220 [Rhodosporidiobolus odoratus]
MGKRAKGSGINGSAPSLAGRHRSSPSSTRTTPASFSLLPPELKLKIAEIVREVDMQEPDSTPDCLRTSAKVPLWKLEEEARKRYLQPGKRTQLGLSRLMNEMFAMLVPCRTGLGALSLTCREMYGICAPMIWDHLELDGRSCTQLLTLIRDILPRHAPLVTSLSYRYDSLITSDSLDDTSENYFDPTHKSLAKAAERLSGVKPHRLLRVRRLRTPNLLLAEVIKRVIKLKEVDMVGFDPLDYLDSEDRAMQEKWEDYALSALVAAKPNLTSVDYAYDSDVDLGNEHFTRLLQNSPGVKKLVVAGGDGVEQDTLYEPKYRALWDAISGLKKLEWMELEILVPPYAVDLPFSCPLRRLQLNETGPDSIPALGNFLRLFSATLDHLELLYVPDPGPDTGGEEQLASEPPHEPFSLPHLKTFALAVSWDASASFLPRLASSPIETFMLDEYTAACIPDILAFLQSHRATLKKVQTVKEDYYPPDPEGQIEAWCAGAGVVFAEVDEEPDSDADTDEDEDEEYNGYGFHPYGAEEFSPSEGSDEDEDEDEDEETEEEGGVEGTVGLAEEEDDWTDEEEE